MEVYMNLHMNQFSLREDGIVVNHSSEVYVLNPKFTVQPAGNKKVRETKQKNVHAYVKGEILSPEEASKLAVFNEGEVWYNPYHTTTFMHKKNPIYNAKGLLRMRIEGQKGKMQLFSLIGE